MGANTDFFRPIDGPSYCAMLMSDRKHLWNNDEDTIDEGGPCCGAARGQNDCESRLGGGLLRQRARRPVEDNHAQGGRAALQKSSGQDEEWLGAVEGAVDAAAGGGQSVEPSLRRGCSRRR